MTVESPQSRRIAHYKQRMATIWEDPTYRAIVERFIAANPVCEYCGRPSSLAHHDADWMYQSIDEYYNPANMTPCCASCHRMYRRGYVICPVCKEHYIKRSSDHCRNCDPAFNAESARQASVKRVRARKALGRARYNKLHPQVKVVDLRTGKWISTMR
jgi:hypothetical protein